MCGIVGIVAKSAVNQAIYDQIDQLEKTEIKTKQYYEYHDYFPFLLLCLFILVCFEFFVSMLFVRVLP